MKRTTLVLALAAFLAATEWTASASAHARSVLRQVVYRGYSFEVPANWPVFDLAADPRTCVRFDRHAVYLGRPGSGERCPSSGAGRTTEAVLIQPWAGSGRSRTLRDPVSD